MIDLVFVTNLDQHDHPIAGMRKLGIKYKSAMNIGLCHMWEFYDCTNVPDQLPRYLINITNPNEKEKE